ncbi:MAG TPA: ABC transporter ATP-binding protein [Gemmatimonadales bacterium]|jgi:lipoprotein-releasing system ATP-binding protein|nr:ABC transporter ATP-binding protein [Gemmatimonadales bacterium]
MSVVLEARELRKNYLGGDGSTIEVLRGLELSVSTGEFVAVTGESGSGKSTLLHLVGALDRPTGGQVLLDGIAYDGLGADALAALRNRKLGFVFQFHHLLRDFSALENVAMPLLIAGQPPAAARERARILLDSVGLGGRVSHLPAQLSGGEQQRAAVARALATGPALLLADEPSGNLDARNAEQLHRLFAGLAREFQTAVIIVTHNRALASRADRVLTLSEGILAPEFGYGAEVGSS